MLGFDSLYGRKLASFTENFRLPAFLDRFTKPLENCKSCGKRHMLSFLRGDLIFLGGFYGTKLIHRESGDEWLSPMSLFNKAGSPPEGIGETEDGYEYAAPIQGFGILDFCGALFRELRDWEECSNGEFRFHQFGYDWRKDLDQASLDLNTFASVLFDENGNRPVHVVSRIPCLFLIVDSMGCLVALSAINKNPKVYSGALFAGPPFRSAPIILWALNRGVPSFINQSLFGAIAHFGFKSSFVFLPRTKDTLLDLYGKSLDLDLWHVDTWKHLSPAFASLDVTHAKQHIQNVLTNAESFLKSIQFCPEKKYPPFVVLKSSVYPTPARFACFIQQNDFVSLSVPILESGDLVVPSESTQMPEGYEYASVSTIYSHMNILNDLNAVKKGLERLQFNCGP